MAKKRQPNESLKCEYCGKQYQLESAFIKHTCKQKQRADARSTKEAVLGLYAFNYFYKRFQGQQQRSFDAFEESPYYNAFVKFAKYCISTKVFAPEKYSEWLVDCRIKIDRWCSDQNYSRFLQYYLKIEPIESALERSIEYSIQWANEKNMQSKDLLRYASDYRLVIAIQSGAISPWVLYLTSSGKDWLNRLQNQYLDGIWEYINADDWNDLMSKRPDDVKYAKHILTLAGW